METAKIGFWRRIKKAILNFDEYEKFITENISKAFGYFFKLITIFSLVITIALVYKMNTETEKVVNTVEKEFPDFSITNNELQMETEKNFEYYFEDLGFNVIIGKNINETNDYKNCLSLLNDKIVLKYDGYSQEITYENAQINNVSKQSIIDKYESKDKKVLYSTVSMIMFFSSFGVYTIVFLIDIITLTIMGLIINIIIRTTFKFKQIFKISVYAMTLPIILYLAYIVANMIWGTTIKYFEIGYNAISYIYLITVLLMMKSDIIKNTQELQKVLDEQKKVREELQREKQEEKEKEEQGKNEEEKKKKPKKDKQEEENKEPKTEPQTEN